MEAFPRAFLVAILSSCLLTSCSLVKENSTQGSFEPGVLRVNLGAEPPSLDWASATDSISFDVVSNMMVGLTQYKDDLTCAPACAKSWEILDGGRRLVFHLRKDIYWTDGQRLTAMDFQYAWQRLLAPQTAAPYAFFLYDIENAYEYNTGKLKDFSQVGVKALDQTTFEVKLKEPKAYFIYLTAYGPTCPVRKDVIEKWGSAWTEPSHIVTNGPFKLSFWQHEYKIELAANEKYFEGQPRLKKIKMFMIPEMSTAFALYESNELDYVDNRSFSTQDVERCQKSPEYRNIALLRSNYLGFNIKKKPFDDLKVRQAFAMAIDRKVFPLILGRREKPAYGWIPTPLKGNDDDSGLPYDPNKARQLLAQAGYPNGQGFPKVSLLYPTREDAKLVVVEIQDQLKRNLGLHIELINEEWKVYMQTLHHDPPPVFRASWGADYPDPQTFMDVFTSHNGNNYCGFASTKYDQMIAKAACEQNTVSRADQYKQADRFLCREETPIVPNYLSTQNVMVKPWVHGMVFNALDVQFLRNVSVGGG